MNRPSALRLSHRALGSIRSHVRRYGCAEEVCGVLLGRRRGDVVTVSEVCPGRNIAARRRDRYRLDPGDLAAAVTAARAREDDLLGFYHSHPEGPVTPSPTDLREAWPGHAYVIVAAGDVEERRAAWWAGTSTWEPLGLVVTR